MRINNKKWAFHSLLLLSSIVLIGSLNGCSDSKHKDKAEQNQEVSAQQKSAPKIEIVQNIDAHAVKVAMKDDGKTQNSSFYYDYGDKGTSEQKKKERTTMDANMNVRSPYEHIQVSLLVRKLSKNFILRCSPCHNDYANGIIGPSLLGRDSDYIYNKIQAFKTGKKSNPLMKDLITMMSDKEIKAMAKEISKFNKEIQKMRKK